MKQFIIIGLCCLLSIKSLAQIADSKITIGTNILINSKILNQDRTIQIYTPESYSNSKEKYPVLYILDGQRFFTNGISIQKSTIAPAKIPEMIVVGINSNLESRYTLFDDESTKLTSFIKNEVISYIDSNYRTTNERIIFGWEAAANYASELTLKEKGLFSGGIISNGGYVSEETLKGFDADKNTYLYIANSRKDIYTISETDVFAKKLQKKNPKNLIWKYELFNDEDHQTVPSLAMHKGLKYYYHNYSLLGFESIQHYIDLGGIPYLNRYFEERAARFGGDNHINNSTKNGLIWLA